MNLNLINSITCKHVISVDDHSLSQFYTYITDHGIYNVNRAETKIIKHNHGIGTGLSHQHAVQHASQNNHEMVIVFEDDMRFVSQNKNKINSIINHVMECGIEWEYLALSHTFLDTGGEERIPEQPDLDKAREHVTSGRIKRVTQHLVSVDMHDIHHNVIGNSCCVVYNNTGYDKFLNTFDPWHDDWCDVWSPKHMKTLLVIPIISYQHNKPWMKQHCESWQNFLLDLK